jgi:hypothetical protein
MTLLACQPRVFLLERPPRARVVESLRASVGPFDEREVPAGVIRMTARAVGSASARVQPAIALDEPRDLAMTRNAARRHRCLPAGMALRAVERSVERRVGRGEWPRRDLCASAREQRRNCDAKREPDDSRPQETSHGVLTLFHRMALMLHRLIRAAPSAMAVPAPS